MNLFLTKDTKDTKDSSLENVLKDDSIQKEKPGMLPPIHPGRGVSKSASQPSLQSLEEEEYEKAAGSTIDQTLQQSIPTDSSTTHIKKLSQINLNKNISLDSLSTNRKLLLLFQYPQKFINPLFRQFHFYLIFILFFINLCFIYIFISLFIIESSKTHIGLLKPKKLPHQKNKLIPKYGQTKKKIP